QKGFDMLLEAFAGLADRYEVDLVLAGEGEDREVLSALIEKFQLKERVVLYGRASSEEVVALLNGCEFCAVPSRFEPFGITALEAIAAGKPVLAMRVGGIPEFLKGPGHLLVE